MRLPEATAIRMDRARISAAMKSSFRCLNPTCKGVCGCFHVCVCVRARVCVLRARARARVCRCVCV